MKEINESLNRNERRRALDSNLKVVRKMPLGAALPIHSSCLGGRTLELVG
jgi:hypothetical protein